MNQAVYSTLKQKDFIVKNFLFKVATELDLSTNELILLIYFVNQETPIFDPEKIASQTYLNVDAAIEAYTRLLGINLITIDNSKDEEGKLIEIINLDNIFKSISTEIVSNIKEETTSDIYELFESEFGRTLSRMEYEIINNWLDSGISTELIEEALKEAVISDIKTFKYVRAILNSWKEKGYKTRNDVIANRVRETNFDKTSTTLFDCDWLHDDK
jgi:DNA replication protein